jgi:hypothetical protein
MKTKFERRAAPLYRKAAAALYASENVKVDAYSAEVDVVEGGAWVAARVFVPLAVIEEEYNAGERLSR